MVKVYKGKTNIFVSADLTILYVRLPLLFPKEYIGLISHNFIVVMTFVFGVRRKSSSRPGSVIKNKVN